MTRNELAERLRVLRDQGWELYVDDKHVPLYLDAFMDALTPPDPETPYTAHVVFRPSRHTLSPTTGAL